MSIWPPIVWLAIQCIALGISLHKKGFIDTFSALLSFGLGGALMWWGNFFAPLGF